MTYASILVQVQTEPALESRLRIACDLARHFNAALIGLSAEMLRAAPYNDGFANVDGAWFTAMRAQITDDQRAGRRLFDCAAADLPGRRFWIEGIDFPTAALTRESRGADLIVTSRAPVGRHDPFKDAHPAELALKSGRPVLVAPIAGASFSASRVVLAWKDTREARRAMVDAMPFFKAADAVLVLEICKADEVKDAQSRTDDVVGALQRHGVKAEARVQVQRLNAGLDIIEQATAFDADLIVCGAYGHSRMGEWVFGGVTDELLSQTTRFVLLSH